MAKRKIIKFDEDKCNGCGLCIPNCPEGAILGIGKAISIVLAKEGVNVVLASRTLEKIFVKTYRHYLAGRFFIFKLDFSYINY